MSFLLDYFLEENKLPGYMLLWLLLFLFAFNYALQIRAYCEKVSKNRLILSAFIFNLLALLLFANGLYENHNHSLGKWLGTFCCVSILALCLNLYKKAKENRFVCFVASISFEIYLMFEIISEGKFSVMKMIENPIVACFVYLLLCLLGGYVLHKFVELFKMLYKLNLISKK